MLWLLLALSFLLLSLLVKPRLLHLDLRDTLQRAWGQLSPFALQYQRWLIEYQEHSQHLN